LLIKLLLLLSSAFCVVYGLCKYLGKRVALFSVLVVAAFGCFMMGHLYEFLSQAASSLSQQAFNVGMLARIGGFSFLFSASYAQMDGLVDDGTVGMKKYRLWALTAPVVMAALYVPVVLSAPGILEKLVYGLVFLFAALAGYYNLKHLIIPDVCSGIIDSIRLCSLFTLITVVCYGLMCAAGIGGRETLSEIFAVALAAAYPCTVITMEKGRRKWTA